MAKVDRHILGPNHEAGADVGFRAAEDCAHSSKQLVGAKRLRQVVVSPHVQRTDLVAFVAPGTDDDDGRHLLAVELTEHLPAVNKWKPNVKQDDINPRSSQYVHGGRPIPDGYCLKATLADGLQQGASEWRVVLNDQKAPLACCGSVRHGWFRNFRLARCSRVPLRDGPLVLLQ